MKAITGCHLTFFFAPCVKAFIMKEIFSFFGLLLLSVNLTPLREGPKVPTINHTFSVNVLFLPIQTNPFMGNFVHLNSKCSFWTTR